MPFLRERSLDGTATTTEAADTQLQLTTHYRPRKDERLSWPGWLTCSGWFTHLSGHPSATGRAQDSESTPAKGRRYTAGPRNQPSAAFSSPALSALPYWSFIFRSCIFHPCSLVPHFPVPHFPVSHFQRPRSWLYFLYHP